MAGRTIAGMFGGMRKAVRARRRVFWGVSAAVALFNLAAPVLILSIAKRSPDFFTFNPYLSRLPEYLVSAEDPWTKKLAFLSQMAIAWCSADNFGEGLEWGFILDVPSVARIAATSFVFGTYFALWSCRRAQVAACGLGLEAARGGGIAGAVTSVLGLTTGPCTLAGCGVPVLPIVGLAFTGLSSGTLTLFATLSRISIAVVLAVMSAAMLWLSFRVGTGPSMRDRAE
jgi:hypothetical protein